LKEAGVSVKMEVLYNIVVEFGVHTKLVGHLSYMFPIQNGCALDYDIMKVQENQRAVK
jgi:hypothetical protein